MTVPTPEELSIGMAIHPLCGTQSLVFEKRTQATRTEPSKRLPDMGFCKQCQTWFEAPEVQPKLACTMCEHPVQNLRDDASRKEASISGLCQGCQDAYFGKEKTAKYDPDYERDTNYWETVPEEDDDPACKTCALWKSEHDDAFGPNAPTHPAYEGMKEEFGDHKFEPETEEEPRPSGKPMYIFNGKGGEGYANMCPKCGNMGVKIDENDAPYCEWCSFKAPPGTEGYHATMGPVRREKQSKIAHPGDHEHELADRQCMYPGCSYRDDSERNDATCKGCGAWLSPVTKAMDDVPYCTQCIKDGVPDRDASVTRLPDWIAASMIASTGLDCYFKEKEPGKWWYGLEKDGGYRNDSPDYDEYGPFDSYSRAQKHLDANHANPGGWSVDAHPESHALGLHTNPAEAASYCEECRAENGRALAKQHESHPVPGRAEDWEGLTSSQYGKQLDIVENCPLCQHVRNIKRHEESIARSTAELERLRTEGPKLSKSKTARPGSGRTYNEWRAVSPEDSKRIHCSGPDSQHRCDQPATWCNQWATDQMAGTAFYYYCDDHAAPRRNNDKQGEVT